VRLPNSRAALILIDWQFCFALLVAVWFIVKYLGLLALYNIMQAHPKAVTEHRDMVIWCLNDEDITIRLRALDLLTGMVGSISLSVSLSLSVSTSVFDVLV
jgi:hypothetical protein